MLRAPSPLTSLHSLRHGGYVFDEKKAKQLKYTHASKDTQDVCVYFDEEIPKGTHILTVEPMEQENVIVSLLLLP